MTDVNGDGLPDIVANGVVKFNHLENGVPTFSDFSSDTRNPLGESPAIVSTGLVTVDQVELQKEMDQAPLHDTVRVWEAPYAGTVTLNAPVRLLEDNSTERQEYGDTADGVRVAIQVREKELWSTRIDANDYEEKIPDNIAPIQVEQGDHIYFRTQSVLDGNYDQVQWAPVITYADVPAQDANKKELFTFKAKDDFLLVGYPGQTISLPVPGKVAIRGTFSKPATSDDVKVTVRHNSQVIWQQLFAAGQPASVTLDESVTVSAGDKLRLLVEADSTIDWSALSWQPEIFYTESADSDIAVKDVRGDYQIKIKPSYEFSLYGEAMSKLAPSPWTAPATGTVTFTPALNLQELVVGKVAFTIKKNGQRLAKQIHLYTVSQDGQQLVTGAAPVTLSVTQGDVLWIEYHSPMVRSDKIAAAAVRVQYSNASEPQFAPAGYYQPREDVKFGPLYRQWGQFAYNGNGDRAALPLIEADLKVDDDRTSPNMGSFESATTEAELEEKFESDGYDSSKDKFVMMIPDLERREWRGFDDLSWVKADNQSSSRYGEDDFSAPEAVAKLPSGTARAVNKIVESSAKSYSLSAGVVGAGFTASGGATRSTGSSRTLVEFMDMNGDRYPDIVGENQIQYTSMLGALEPGVRGFVDPKGLRGLPRQQNTTAEGVSVGGSYNGSKNSPNQGPVEIRTIKEANMSMPSLGLSGDFGRSDDHEDFGWEDVNGDGLPDRVYPGGDVALNLGYRFEQPENWGFGEVSHGHSKNSSAGLGYTTGAYSIGAGISLSKASNEQQQTLSDVNGDGLPDIVQLSSPLQVRLNNGNGFQEDPISWTGAHALVQGSSSTEAVSAYFTICIPIVIPVPKFKLCFNGGGSKSQNASRQEKQLADINGDGFPDFLESTDATNLKVSSSTIGRSNLLKQVSRPLGATIALDYTRVGNERDMPQSRWVMNKVEVTDGVTGDGPDTQVMTFKYEKGFYDRRERDFYGFKTVIAESRDTSASADNPPVYRVVTRAFNNDNYYEKGLLLSETMTDAADKRFTETSNAYALKDVASGNLLTTDLQKRNDTATAFPQLVETTKQFFEGGSQSKSTRMSYAYDDLGNVSRYSDFGDTGTADDLIATMSYHALNSLYVMSEPSSIVVRNAAGELLRRRESTLDASANLTELRRYLGNGSAITHNFTYEPNGNVATVQRPANASGQRYTLTYSYDADVATHATSVSDSFGYVSQADYDLRWGAVSESRDLNAQKIQSTFDPFGRLETITGPYEQSQATLRFVYHPEAMIPWALTQHHDEGRDPLETVLFTDGLKRVLQTKKDGAVAATGGGSASDVMIVSGRVTFDAFGRTVAQFHPVTEGLGSQGSFNASFDGVAPTRTVFDVLDREVQTTLPDNSVFRTSYDFGTDRDGLLQFRTTATDANGVKKERFTDVRGRQTALLEHNAKGGQANLWTSYRYNAINELIQVKDDKAHLTSAEYDLLGRRTALQNPDAGREERVYDAASNLVQRSTSNLREKGVAIQYDYDFERLAATRYPLYPDNNVRYHYGAANATDNRVGRLAKVEDASGVEEFFYGPLGETTKTVRTLISLTGKGAKTYTTQFRYDTWNRIRELTYPDGEVLSYGYNGGGLLNSIQGKKGNDSYAYLNTLSYDKFEQRVFQALGNGTTMKYAYEPERRRLATLQSANAQRTFMDLRYGYDRMTNILELKNQAPAGTSPDAFGGPTQQSFAYDDLYRLTSAKGHWTNWQGHQERYSLALNYDTIHNLTKKTQTHERTPNGSNWLPEKKTNYDWAYAYGSSKPHAATHIGERSFGYDSNGNQLGWDNDKNGQRRGIVWDEENRIRSLSDNGRTQTYLYDANGERVLKRGRQGETAYVNGYFVIRNGAVASKHVFNGTQRLATKLVMQESTTIPDPNGNGGSDNNGVGNGNVPPGWIRHGKTSNPGANFPSAQDRQQQLSTATAYPGNVSGGTVYEHQQYFYHPDHVGSTGFVTDANGAVYEHLEYFAFGETWVQERSNIERTPYLFTGKELDEETQLYYFGARYYDPRTSQWQSVDPILDKYMSGDTNGGVYNSNNLGLYTYSYHNPINLKDPDGRAPRDGLEKVAYLRNQIKSSGEKYGVSPQAIGSIVYQEKFHGGFAAAKNVIAYAKNGFEPTPGASYGYGEMQLQLSAKLLGLDASKNPDYLRETFNIVTSDAQAAMDLVAANIKNSQDKIGRKLTPREATVLHNAGEKGLSSLLKGEITDERAKGKVYSRSWNYQNAISEALGGTIRTKPDNWQDCFVCMEPSPEKYNKTWEFDGSMRTEF